MIRINSIKIRYKIVSIALISVTITLLPLLIVFLITEYTSRKNDFNHNIKLNSQLVAEYLVAPISFEDYEGANELLTKLKEINYIKYATIVDTNGNIKASFGEKLKLKKINSKSDINKIYDDGINVQMQIPIQYQNFNYGCLCVLANYSHIESDMINLLILSVSLFFVVIILTFFIANYLQNYISKPILNLADITLKISQSKQFNTQIPVTSDDEIGDLYKQYNLLLQNLYSYEIERNNAEAKLIEFNKALEETIENRTSELRTSNSELSIEIENRKIAEQKLVDINTTKDKFFSILAHDLRNPLASFGISLEMLKSRYYEIEDKAKIFFLSNMETSTHFLNNLLEELLSWASVSGGKILPEFEVLDLQKLVDASLGVLMEQANLKNVQIINKCEASFNIFADRNMISTIIRNLVSNAIKFTPELGSVTLSAIDNGDYIELSIQDTGIGINEAAKENLFKLEYARTSLGTNKEKGNGLGLVLCQEFIELNGGSIWVDSKEGEGTTFTVFIRKYEDSKSKENII